VMSLAKRIERARRSPSELERIYRTSLASGDEPRFKNEIMRWLEAFPRDVLPTAWAHRLDLPVPSGSEAAPMQMQRDLQTQKRNWLAAIAISVILAALFAVIAHGKPPIPLPGEANPLFWIGWAPAAAWAILLYLWVAGCAGWPFWTDTGPGVAVLIAAAYTASFSWGKTGPVAVLVSLHLPVAAWAAIGIGLSLKERDPYRQGYAYMVKSLEVVLAGGIFFGMIGIFLALTGGIFSVLGVTIPESVLVTAAAGGIGFVPVIAVAVTYLPSYKPAEQNLSGGLIRILKIVSSLLLPLALGVLAIYIAWFIPSYFWRPFQDRNVLIIYNATILSILVLTVIVVAGPESDSACNNDRLMYCAVFALCSLTLLLNGYALSAILYRTTAYGLSPNRYACLGWNVITLTMELAAIASLLKNRSKPWRPALRETLSRSSLLAVGWTCWVVFILPVVFL